MGSEHLLRKRSSQVNQEKFGTTLPNHTQRYSWPCESRHESLVVLWSNPEFKLWPVGTLSYLAVTLLVYFDAQGNAKL